jgi:hypothetical protein
VDLGIRRAERGNSRECSCWLFMRARVRSTAIGAAPHARMCHQSNAGEQRLATRSSCDTSRSLRSCVFDPRRARQCIRERICSLRFRDASLAFARRRSAQHHTRECLPNQARANRDLQRARIATRVAAMGSASLTRAERSSASASSVARWVFRDASSPSLDGDTCGATRADVSPIERARVATRVASLDSPYLTRRTQQCIREFSCLLFFRDASLRSLDGDRRSATRANVSPIERGRTATCNALELLSESPCEF